jgi:cytidine deaminase
MSEPIPETRLQELLADARRAALSAYCPYSNFRVGAALIVADPAAPGGRRVLTGCNVENASYGLSMCAERTASFKMAAEGLRTVLAVAVSCIDGGADPATRMPCGACRQVLSEFCADDVPVVIDGVGTVRFDALLPMRFKLRP